MYKLKPVIIVAEPGLGAEPVDHLRSHALRRGMLPVTFHPQVFLRGLPKTGKLTGASMLPEMAAQEAHRVAMSGGQLWVITFEGTSLEGLALQKDWFRLVWKPWSQALGGLARGRLRVGPWSFWASDT